MAINSNILDNLYPAYDTSVKFYASLTRNQALGRETIGKDKNNRDVFVEPGAVCFVSDAKGNSIFLNNRLFGDGAVSGSGSGTSGGGITEVNLSDIVVVEKDGHVLKTLADYFKEDGQLITDSFKVTTTKTNAEGTNYQVDVVVIDSNGITINSSKVLTEEDLEEFKKTFTGGESITNLINQAETNAKNYADSLISSVYKILGSVASYSDLSNVLKKNGYVYNVLSDYGVAGTSKYYPAGTNFVYIEVTDTTSSNYPGYWDALGGTIDLSAYKTAANTTIEIQSAVQEAKGYTDTQLIGVNNDITNLNAYAGALDGRVTLAETTIALNTTNILTNSADIETNTNNISLISTLLTWQ